MKEKRLKAKAELFAYKWIGSIKPGSAAQDGYITGYHYRDEEVRQLRKALEKLNTLEKVSNLSDGEIVGIVNKVLNK